MEIKFRKMARPQNPGEAGRQPAPWNQWPANPAAMMPYHVYPQGYNPAMYFNMAPAPPIPRQPTPPTLKRPAPSPDANSAKDVTGSKDHHRYGTAYIHHLFS